MQKLWILKKKRGQSINPLWQTERCKRIHFSNFGRICKCTDGTDKVKLACRLTKYVSQINAPSIFHGKYFESVAIKCFEEKCEIKTQKCGTFVSKSHPFLAASPDAIIDDNSIAEVKCPYTSKHEKITKESVSFLKNANDSLELDKSHDYYYQIQRQIFCTERTNCILVVYTFKDLKIINVPRDQEFICTMLEKLESFLISILRKQCWTNFIITFEFQRLCIWTKSENVKYFSLYTDKRFWVLNYYHVHSAKVPKKYINS